MRPDLWLPQGADEQHVARALREYDPDLRLLPGLDARRQVPLYRVYRYMGSDRDAVFVCAWQADDGTPLPLSSALLDMVKLLDRNTRVPAPDADDLEAQRRDRMEKDEQDHLHALIDDWRVRERRSAMLPRGQGLRRARDKARARGEKI